MEKPTYLDDESNDTLLKAVVLAVILICLAIVKAVKGSGDSTNFPGRAKWLAIHILKTLPRVFSRTAESVFSSKARYDRIAKGFQAVWDEIFKTTNNRREGDKS